METRHDANPEAVFGHNFLRNRTPISGWGPSRKRYPKIEAWKITSFGSMRVANRFCDPRTFLFGFRNGVIRDGLFFFRKSYSDYVGLNVVRRTKHMSPSNEALHMASA